MLLTFLTGMGTGGGLIIAIGAQNAFVLSQGVRKNHYILIPLICAVCDAILVAIGVAGVGTFIASSKLLSQVAGMGGAAFLFCYGVSSFRSAIKGAHLEANQKTETSLKAAVLTTLAVTLLNPHVYIDTILLLGSIAGQFQAPGHLVFGAGAATASFIWFFTLSLASRLLAPLFRKEHSWRILDTLVGMVMWAIAFSVLKTSLSA
ncbi:MAG: LysE/ArgO family amino acid transporter [Proteobacteria bacterium]|nr:amino acid transporter [Desulfobacula sp.]MBU3952932.1 LysE/ArgO family amino acid transporter [Pseudomonadota bacterium]MBU4131053.1 LysE/ArgO family amino acid transporter [Pseudomonadota bacterium]